MNYSLAAFQEPRGVMRILQFIFAICAFATTTNFMVTVDQKCDQITSQYVFDYPFSRNKINCTPTDSHYLPSDVSTDAQFYVATGVLSLMYCVFIIIVYVLLDELYKSKSEIPLADFMITTILAIFWLSGSAAWSNGTSGMKNVLEPSALQSMCPGCTFITSTFSKLNISLILGFLNFFLWASDLWFLYKETIWFQGRNAGTQPAV